MIFLKQIQYIIGIKKENKCIKESFVKPVCNLFDSWLMLHVWFHWKQGRYGLAPFPDGSMSITQWLCQLTQVSVVFLSFENQLVLLLLHHMINPSDAWVDIVFLNMGYLTSHIIAAEQNQCFIAFAAVSWGRNLYHPTAKPLWECLKTGVSEILFFLPKKQ